jgi:uncharacterized membrane protein
MLTIIFIPSSIARIILGLPFILFFPGYALMSALFTNKEGIDGIELVALSLGLSIATVALIGLGLNYTPWGISLETVLASIAVFIIVTSEIAFIRRRLRKSAKFTTEFSLRPPGWGGSILNKSLSILIIVSIFGVVGILGYTVAEPKTGEIYSEFYILGHNGQAQDYPVDFLTTGGNVTSVKYSSEEVNVASNWGNVTLGIVNHEQQQVTYSVKMRINSNNANINYEGKSLDQIGNIELKPEQKWEQEIGFAPQQVGDNQKVELLLFKNSDTTAVNSLHIWVNVKEGQK